MAMNRRTQPGRIEGDDWAVRAQKLTDKALASRDHSRRGIEELNESTATADLAVAFDNLAGVTNAPIHLVDPPAKRQ